MTCGVTASTQQLTSSDTTAINKFGRSKLRGAIDGVMSTPSSSPLMVEVLPTSEARPHDDVGAGYTCGLWMLFHYLTGENY